MEATNDKPRSPQINVKMTEDERVFFSRVGRARGLSISALARSLMLEEGRRLGLSIDDKEAQLAESRRRKWTILADENPDE